MSSNRPEPFWLCHECSAQMRPIRIDGVPHCASCNGEFIEILDSAVNPDPFHDLPPPPPVRPSSGPAQSSNSIPGSLGEGAQGGLMQSIFGNFFSPVAQDAQQSTSTIARNNNLNQEAQGSGGGRALTFNFPGGGRGRVMFGSINGQMGPFGPMGDNQPGGLETFFPGFAAPPRDSGAQRLGGSNGDPPPAPDFLTALMQILSEDGTMPQSMMGGSGRGHLGDYVMTEEGFNDVLERLMQAAGPQGPIPAADVVIEGLPRITFTSERLAKSPYKDCPVCKDDFSPGEEVMRVPCTHVFHPDCLQPWLKVNGSCPVCRFSLVPEEGNPPREAQQQGSQQNGETSFTGMLQRLWGQSGGASVPTSPTDEARSPLAGPSRPTQQATSPNPLEDGMAGQAGRISREPPSTEHPSPTASSQDQTSPFPTSIPEDYRVRHRRREQEQHEHHYDDDLD